MPNGDFEHHKTSCNKIGFTLNFQNTMLWYPNDTVTNWDITYYGTPDYYSSCQVDTQFLAPTNWAGYQIARSGNAYIGLGKLHGVAKEFTRIQLKQPLQPNVCYTLEFYYSLASASQYAINQFGMVLSTDSFKTCIGDSLVCPGYNVIYPVPQLFDSNVNDDTLTWKQVKGEYFALGGEQWLTLGWFVASSQIDTLMFWQSAPNNLLSYYYIDDVSVHLCTDDEDAIVLPQFISPNGDLKNDFYIIDSLPANSRVTFYNRWGNEVYQSDNYQNEWAGTWNGQLLPSGTYYVVVQMPFGTIKTTFVELVY